MKQFLIQSVVFILSSILSILLIYLSRSHQFYQQLIPILLILAIGIASRIKSDSNSRLGFSKLSVLLISSLLVQTVVLSSGGFYSPLLILLHIYTLGTILLLSSSSPIIYLVSSLGVLIFHISFDKNLNQFFQNDPWAVAIYALSIIIVIPLALYLSHSNSVKSKFNDLLRDYIEMSEKRQKSILTAISNMVIITNTELKITSVNIAVERLLHISAQEVEGKPLNEVLFLKNQQGFTIFLDDLPIQQALTDKASHIVEGYSIETRIDTIPKPITIQIRPLTNPQGETTQVVFVLTDPLVKIGFNTHPTVNDALRKRDLLLASLTSPKPLLALSATQIIVLITHIEEDILIAQEMEDHPLQEVIGFADLVSLTKQVVAQKSVFYQSIGNIPQVSFEDDDRSETAFLNLHSQELGQFKMSKYTVAVDRYLLKLVLEKMIDFAVLAGGPQNKIQIRLSLLPENIKIEILMPSANLTQNDLLNFLNKNYPGIKLPNLNKSSGLEGYIAGKISRTINLSVETALNPYKKTVTIALSVLKKARIHPS